jgi:phosphatidylglycerophosphate synthase
MYEIWMLENVTCWVEQKLLPQWWSPNAITVIGNLPLLIAGVMAVCVGGTRFHDDEKLGKVEPLPSWALLFGAFSIQWFSWFDMMDG